MEDDNKTEKSFKGIDKWVHRVKEYAAILIFFGGILISASLAYQSIFDNTKDIKIEQKERKAEIEVLMQRSDKRYNRASDWKNELDSDLSKLLEKEEKEKKELILFINGLENRIIKNEEVNKFQEKEIDRLYGKHWD